MKDTQLIFILKSLLPEEIRELGRFVHSPFFNNRNEVAEYFSLLKKFYPRFSSGNFTKENIHKLIYPHKKFNDTDIRRLNSSLTKLVENFFAYKGLSQDDFYFRMSLAEQFNIRKLNTPFDKKMNLLDKDYSSFNGDAENYFWKKYFIEREKHSNYMLTQRDHLAGESINNRADYFTYYIVINLCKILTSLSINEKNFNADFSKTDFFEFYKRLNLESFVNHLQETGNKYYPLIAIHYFQAMAFRNPDNDTYFSKYKQLIENNIYEFSYIEKINFYTIFEAVCTLRIENGDTSVRKELFNAYKRMLKLGLYSFTPGGYFILKLFRNFILIGVQMKELKWLKDFIKDYIDKIHSDSRKNMKSFAEAYILFEENKFENALESLSKIDYEIFHFKIDIKNLQLKIYYELNLFNESYSLIDTYKHFITNNKFISERYKLLAGNFISLVHRLLRVKEAGDKTEAYIIKKELTEKRNTLFDEWLVSKAEQIAC